MRAGTSARLRIAVQKRYLAEFGSWSFLMERAKQSKMVRKIFDRDSNPPR